jgi:hypothetical protein
MDELKNTPLEATILSAFASVLVPNRALYAAVPVTSGRRLWKLAQQLGASDLHEVARLAPDRYDREVVSPNSAYAREFTSAARKRHSLVIDPSCLIVTEWSQGQYWRFWERIILKYAKAVLLSDEWAYSRGCVYECMFAIQNSIPVFSAEDSELTVRELRDIAFKAIRERESLGIKAGFLDEFIQVTHEISAKKGQYPT